MTHIRIRYLKVLKELVNKSMYRHSKLVTDMCPGYCDTEKIPRQNLKAFAQTNRQIDVICDQLRAIERQAHNKIGVPNLLGKSDASNPARIIMAFLTARMLTKTVAFECGSIMQLCEQASANRVEDLLSVRQAFEPDGILRPHILWRSQWARVLAEYSDVTFTETAYAKYLALPLDSKIIAEIATMSSMRDRR